MRHFGQVAKRLDFFAEFNLKIWGLGVLVSFEETEDLGPMATLILGPFSVGVEW